MDFGGGFLGSGHIRSLFVANDFLTWTWPCFQGGLNRICGRGRRPVMPLGALVFAWVCTVRGWWESDVLCLASLSVYVINLVQLMDTALHPVVSVC